MQTFLPSTSYKQSAQRLDNQRLGKQRVEAFQILRALTDSNYGWQHHPAVKMWKYYEASLVDYGIEICDEWVSRGYKDSCAEKILDIKDKFLYRNYIVKPDWLTEEFASNHRAVLLGKAWEKYACLSDEFYQKSMFNFNDKKSRNKIIRKRIKAKEVLRFYQSHNWSETPAQRNEKGQWPYIWPTKIIDI